MDFHSAREDYLQSIDFDVHAKNHINSFNYFLSDGLDLICSSLPKIELSTEMVNTKSFNHLSFWFEKLTVGTPSVKPFETRLTHSTYSIPLFVTLNVKIDDEDFRKSFSMGDIPVMMLSKNCILNGKTDELDLHNEDKKEPGGYFIVNGLEKILRNIIIPRKNFPLAIFRPTFHQRKKQLSGFAVMVKSTTMAFKSQTIYMHYGTDNNMYITLMIKKSEYVFPAMLILKALTDLNDKQLVDVLKNDNDFNPTNLIEDLYNRGLTTQESCLAHLGSSLRNLMGFYNNKSKSEIEIGKLFLKNHVLIHLEDNNTEKIKLLVLMMDKAIKLYNEKIDVDNLDALTTQEVLTSGQIYGLYFREKLEETLNIVKAKIIKDQNRKSDIPILDSIEKFFSNSTQIGKKLEHLLATGNLKSNTGLDLMQNNGYSIIAERLNNSRFWSHLRSVHRGAYFVEMKTTQVRKLLPESWGFMCPVHTPDGGLCGLLNHLSTGCIIQSSPINLKNEEFNYLKNTLNRIGMTELTDSSLCQEDHLNVILDGRVLGSIETKKANRFVESVRKTLKNPENEANHKFITLSVTALVHDKRINKSPDYPCIYMSLSEGRPLRKVYNIKYGFIEVVDPLEQCYMMISTTLDELTESHTHIELQLETLLSELAAQIPYMVHNQSPRNMYQCQMAKQTMGLATHALSMRADNKMYTLNFPQKPITTAESFDALGFDEFPSGINSVVAVLSYTGYDIEDAMIINKSAYERGFMHGHVEKTYILDMNNERTNKPSMLPLNRTDDYKEKYSQCQEPATERYDINDLLNKKRFKKKTGVDGLPIVGESMKNEDIKLQFYDIEEQKLKAKYYKEIEDSTVESVILCSKKEKEQHNLLNLKFRYNRNPVVGDKFSSRHGQKGVMSMLWPQTDMPFTESGITPDIIINPNAFPSRMTIGMLIESMAGKNACLQGKLNKTNAYDLCDWKSVGKELESQGYSHLGTEIMYSGVYGVPLKTEIYQGVVYYQRLRHMIKDKAQARATGPIDVLTHQPIKGRKKGGGIRFGEMERDALIAHGVSYILKDRLMNCSDSSDGYICKACGNLLSSFQKEDSFINIKERICVTCNKKGVNSKIEKVKIPYVLRYLTNELAAMNIKVEYKTN